MHHDWTVTATIQWPNGEFINEKQPFGDYHIEANTAEEAIHELEEDFSGCKVKVYGKPRHSIVTDEEYNKE